MNRKFHHGPLVTSLTEFVAGIYQGYWFYLNDKPQDRSWLENMTLKTLSGYIENQRVHYAIRVSGE